VEKTVDRCELSIVEGDAGTQRADDDEENQDSLESKLIIQLYCKHGMWSYSFYHLVERRIELRLGVLKTHRLQLQTPTSLMAPGVPDALNESRLTIGPRALKDMLEHFPAAKGTKNDPQLIWSFGESEVQIKSMETAIDAKGEPFFLLLTLYH
jgi:cell cycle checkpoint control protein RAD9A